MTLVGDPNGVYAKIVEDSINEKGDRLITYELQFWRPILAEVNTHKVLSKSAGSSRAIPLKRRLKQVRENPALPIHWGSNQPGMQARAELTGARRWAAHRVWDFHRYVTIGCAMALDKIGLHKQVGNRLMEVYVWQKYLVSGTQWENFFRQRDHEDAQPEFAAVARCMNEARNSSEPKLLRAGEWHLPYVSEEERKSFSNEDLITFSMARCARTSFEKYDGGDPDWDADRRTAERLKTARPPHFSPSEHQATPIYDLLQDGKNYVGWQQYRDVMEKQMGMDTTD